MGGILLLFFWLLFKNVLVRVGITIIIHSCINDPVILIYTLYPWQNILSSPLNTTWSFSYRYIKCTPDVAFVGSLLDILFDQFVTEAAGVRHNNIYSVNCVRIACRSKNIMVLGYTQVLILDKYLRIKFMNKGLSVFQNFMWGTTHNKSFGLRLTSIN